ncbi:MAG: hypothetical protein C0605_06055 [Hyphomicrobiales bacterium]|nr:MAG: hypothetical protein C0605_06055 [Hyphomicrobiales bacterium]
MSPNWILAAQLAHMALTLGLLAWLGLSRVRAAKAGAVKLDNIALSSEGWPARVRQIGNNYQSQFELPVMFHILCLLLLMQGPVHIGFAVLAWAFVALRCVHSLIHVTSNHVIRRFQVFLAGVVVVALMAAGLALQLVMKAL